MPHPIPATDHPTTVTDNPPPEPATSPAPGDRAEAPDRAGDHTQPTQPTNPASQHPQPTQPTNPASQHPQPHGVGDGTDHSADPQKPARRQELRGQGTRPARINANTVIGALIGVIGMVGVFLLAYGIQSINTRLDDQNASIDRRFASVDRRFDGIESRLAAVEADLRDLRQDVNHINARLDALIAVLEASSVIPAGVVSRSPTTTPSP